GPQDQSATIIVVTPRPRRATLVRWAEKRPTRRPSAQRAAGRKGRRSGSGQDGLPVVVDAVVARTAALHAHGAHVVAPVGLVAVDAALDGGGFEALGHLAAHGDARGRVVIAGGLRRARDAHLDGGQGAGRAGLAGRQALGDRAGLREAEDGRAARGHAEQVEVVARRLALGAVARRRDGHARAVAAGDVRAEGDLQAEADADVVALVARGGRLARDADPGKAALARGRGGREA